jgi:hypothetical protein
MRKSFILWMALILCCCCTAAASARDVYYDRLLDQHKFKQLEKMVVTRMQQNLAVIYRNDRDWQRDVAQSRHPLTDGVLGPVTLFWLQRFTHDFKIEPIGDYVSETKLRLDRIASFAKMFPEETDVLISSDFFHWNDDQPELQKYRYYDVRRKGADQALLDLVYLYLQIVDPVPGGARIGGSRFAVYYYQLTAEDFKILQGKNQINEQLSKLVNKQFDNVAALKEAVGEALKDYPDLVDKLMPVIQRYYRYADPVITQGFLDVLMGDSLFTSLNGILADLLDKSLSGVAYPDQRLFEQAVKSKIYDGIGACQDIDQQNAYVLGLRINDDDFKKLTQDLMIGPYQGIADFSYQVKQIDLLRLQRRDECGEGDFAFVKTFVAELYETAIQPAIAALYKKKPAYSSARPVQWSSKGCGCLMDDLSGTVYGFYPFWLADGKTQAIDFNVLSRVAYYGLSFDENGVLRQANNPHNDATVLSTDKAERDSQTGFVQVVRKYDSQLDWVIHNDKPYWDWWKTQTSATRAAILNALAENIARLLATRIPGQFSTIGQSLPFGVEMMPTLGDGVTIYFNDFPGDAESVAIFNRFFADLQKQLLGMKNDYFVNILVPQSALGAGLYRYFNLLSWIDTTKFTNSANSLLLSSRQENLQTKILVLIEEPTTDAKKELRLDVERGELHGIERELLLRSIIPVIQFDGRNWKQLEDDVVYFKSNFGGIGFWPLAVNEAEVVGEIPFHCDGIKSVSGCLIRFFQASTWYGEPESLLEKFVCENRTYFRLALGLLTVLSLLFVSLYFYSCRVHHRIKNHYVFYLSTLIIPMMVIALLLLTYDPALESISRGNLPLITVLFVMVAASVIAYQRRRKQLRKPSRFRKPDMLDYQIDRNI